MYGRELAVHNILCTKQNGPCAKVHPQYVGETEKTAKWRCARHIGTATNSTNPSQADTTHTLPVGVHFRLHGHSHADLQFTPIEKVQSKDPQVRRIREMLSIQQVEPLKHKDADIIEHGLNLHN